MVGINTHLRISIHETPEAAVDAGKVYRNRDDAIYTPVDIVEAVVVRNGTEQGNSAVDLVMQDASGKKYVVMITGRLLKSIPC